MYYTYILRSLRFPRHIYFGFSTHPFKRLTKHNNGESPHTSKYKPWKIVTYFAYANKQTALDFKKYLKSHSDKAFMRKRLLSNS